MEQPAKPAFELILSGIENAPADQPFDPDQIKRLTDLYFATREHYSRIINGMLGAEIGAPGLPLPLLHGAQMLHRRLANAFGQAALRCALRPDAVEPREVAELALHSLHARTEEIKWHGFESTMPGSISWQNANALLLGLESLGAERQVLVDGGTCVDAFAQCILLATLNVGILSPPQVELAHRWLSVCGWGLQIEPFFDPETHWYQIDLEQSRGPERISPNSAISDATRFVAVAALGPLLAQARTKLYAGELDVPATPNRIVALHFGAFLDLAERLWSPDWRKATWRDPRTIAKGEQIEVVIGFDQVIAALGGNGEAGVADSTPRASWLLRDKCKNGLGALLPEDAGIRMRLGALIAFRASADDDWQIGSIVRRVRAADETLWLAGIKRISDSPVALALLSQAHGPSPAPGPLAIYAPVSSGAGRIDSLLLDADEFARGGQYQLPTRGGAFRIRLDRVIDRGDRWVRVGFEVLGKQ